MEDYTDDELLERIKSARDSGKGMIGVVGRKYRPYTHRIRRIESDNGIYLKDYPDKYKSFNAGELHSMRCDRLMTDREIARELGIGDHRLIHSIMNWFGITVPDDDLPRYKDRIAEERKSLPKRVMSSSEREARKETWRKIKESGGMDEITRRQRSGFIKKYGTGNPMDVPEIREKIEQTNLERYGSKRALDNPEVKCRAEETLKGRFGVKNPFQSSDVQEKARRTVEKKYGGTGMSSTELREKIRKTNLEKYGVEWATQIPEARDKAKKTYLEHYGVDNVFASKVIQRQLYDAMMDKYGVGYPQQVPEIREKTYKTIEANGAAAPARVSKLNRRVAGMIESSMPDSEVTFEPALGSIGNADLKISHHGRMVMIDLNPTVTHNSLIPFPCILNDCGPDCERHLPVREDHHYKRSMEGLRLDLSYAQFYEWDSFDVIMGWLDGKLLDYEASYSARRLDCVRIKQSEANSFLHDTHIQGASRGQAYCYALKDGDVTVAVGTFGRPRFDGSVDYEWIRYAVRPGVQVHGGQGAIFKTFMEDVGSGKTVISYIDFNHSTRQKTFLESLGFVEVRKTGPSLVWSKCGKNRKIPESSLVRLGADRLLGTSYGSPGDCGMDNHQIMVHEGWLPVYTAGNRVYVYGKKRGGS